jgi:hypothetical protein
MPRRDGYFKPAEAHRFAKLTEARVRLIRASDESIDVLAARFDVNRTSVARARTGQTRGTVTGLPRRDDGSAQ